MLGHVASGNMGTLWVPVGTMLAKQKAADMLRVSRPHPIKLLAIASVRWPGGPISDFFAVRVRNRDELACAGCDDNLVWLSRGSQAATEGFQETVKGLGPTPRDHDGQVAVVRCREGRPGFWDRTSPTQRVRQSRRRVTQTFATATENNVPV